LHRRLSTAGLVQFFTFGHLWNQDTLLAEIQCMPPATVAVFDQQTSVLRQECYWRPKAARRQDVPTSLTRIDAALKTAIDERTTDADHLGMSLSGGLDARTLLGVMDCSRTPTTCVSLGMEGSLDQRSARQ
jgi:asparagine synthetase B (glutamine-hydrolysing)